MTKRSFAPFQYKTDKTLIAFLVDKKKPTISPNPGISISLGACLHNTDILHQVSPQPRGALPKIFVYVLQILHIPKVAQSASKACIFVWLSVLC